MSKRPHLHDENDLEGLIGIGPLPGTAPVASFNLDAIENLINSKGFSCLHYRFALSPDRETLVGGGNPNTQEAQHGGRYYSVRWLKAVPQQFKLSDQLSVAGIWDTNSVLLNISGNYLDGAHEAVYIMPRDLIVLNPTITIPVRQLAEYNPNGPMSLNYKVKGVEYLASKHGQFCQGTDFVVEGGKIVWVPGGKKPNFLDGKGDILSVVFYITPIYIVQNAPHSLRVLPDNHEGMGGLPRYARYAPQLIVAQQSHLREESSLLDFSDLPEYPSNPDSKNTTGGS
jgi:hypothetical protein